MDGPTVTDPADHLNGVEVQARLYDGEPSELCFPPSTDLPYLSKKHQSRVALLIYAEEGERRSTLRSCGAKVDLCCLVQLPFSTLRLCWGGMFLYRFLNRWPYNSE